MPRLRRPRLSWFRFYPDDFLGGTGALSAPECGQYLLLLLHQWGSKEQQLIPSEVERLRRICRGEEPSASVLSKFEQISEGLRNQRLAAEWSAAHDEYEGKAAPRKPGHIPPHIPSQTVGQTVPNILPPTKNQEPRTKNQDPRRTSAMPMGGGSGVEGNGSAGQQASAPTNLLVAGRRVELERELLTLVRREAEITDRDGAEVMASVTTYDGAKRSKLNPATMTDDRLLNSVLDARARVKRLEAEHERQRRRATAVPDSA